MKFEYKNSLQLNQGFSIRAILYFLSFHLFLSILFSSIYICVAFSRIISPCRNVVSALPVYKLSSVPDFALSSFKPNCFIVLVHHA